MRLYIEWKLNQEGGRTKGTIVWKKQKVDIFASRGREPKIVQEVFEIFWVSITGHTLGALSLEAWVTPVWRGGCNNEKYPTSDSFFWNVKGVNNGRQKSYFQWTCDGSVSLFWMNSTTTRKKLTSKYWQVPSHRRISGCLPCETRALVLRAKLWRVVGWG